MINVRYYYYYYYVDLIRNRMNYTHREFWQCICKSNSLKALPIALICQKEWHIQQTDVWSPSEAEARCRWCRLPMLSAGWHHCSLHCTDVSLHIWMSEWTSFIMHIKKFPHNEYACSLCRSWEHTIFHCKYSTSLDIQKCAVKSCSLL